MARYVKISTIGGPYHHVDESLTYPEVWEKMKTHLTNQIGQVLPDRPDLIVLTEVVDLPAYYPTRLMKEFVDYRGNDNINFFGRIAKENKCNISFSTITRGKGDYYFNTTIIVDREGNVAGRYNKYYPTYTEILQWDVRCGTETPVIRLDFGNVVCAICFDLNFDDLKERYKALKPEIIIFSSQFHGGLMQKTWANECRAFFVGAIAHQRPSSILSPLGEELACSTDYLNYATGTINLDYALVHLRDLNQMLELKKKYGAGVTIYDPFHLGYFMLTNDMPDLTVGDMIKEFDIMTYDEYIDYSVNLRNEPGRQARE